ncbi:tripartite tricarboxylate transporter TctB family protein [Paraburkholderia caffeinilytica]|uniref:tripartite tricarboxylate transporter TctB family protein n=1 Tax=Paraburkholderia caffeinilytica TaxID=1761016 RepID=UPI0038BC1090
MKTKKKDLHGGILMFAIGAAAILEGTNYQVGTLGEMGPGFFPVALGAILAVTGIAIAIARTAESAAQTPRQPAQWRGWLCIVSSIGVFVLLGSHGGLLPATFATVFIAALGDRQNTFKSALILATTMTIICVTVFWWALQVQFPLFQWQ